MRAIVITLVAAAMALTACGGDDQAATDASPPEATTQTTTEETTTERTTTEEETTGTTTAAGTAKELEACLRDAGAKLATSPADLRFAAGSAIGGDVRTDISARRGNLRMYSLRPSGGDGWRIYVAVPRSAGGAPGISDLLGDPGAAVVTAYVNPADGTTVREADACMTG